MSDLVETQIVGFLMHRLKCLLLTMVLSNQGGKRKENVKVSNDQELVQSGPEVIKHFSCSTQLRLKFILLINVKMPTIVGILTFMSGINF